MIFLCVMRLFRDYNTICLKKLYLIRLQKNSRCSVDEIMERIEADSDSESDVSVGDNTLSSSEEEIDDFRMSGKDDPCTRDSALNYDEDFIAISPHLLLTL